MPGLGWLVTGGLVAARISGVLMVLPVYGTTGVPVLIRILTAVLLTAVVAPVVPQAPDPGTLTMLTLAIGAEVMVGVLVGGVIRMVFGGLALAGELIGSQTGHGAALQFDPTLQISQGPVGAVGTFLASAVFVGVDLHLQVFLALGDSFFLLPAGAAGDLPAGGVFWVRLVSSVIDAGVRLAMPIIVLVFLINLFVAVVTRLSPQMNIFFSLGIILTTVAGQLLYFVTLPHMLHAHTDFVRQSMDLIPSIIDALRGGR